MPSAFNFQLGGQMPSRNAHSLNKLNQPDPFATPLSGCSAHALLPANTSRRNRASVQSPNHSDPDVRP